MPVACQLVVNWHLSACPSTRHVVAIPIVYKARVAAAISVVLPFVHLQHLHAKRLTSRQGTTCNVKSSLSGCCPKGAVCNAPPTCYEHGSLDCIGSSPKKECCPADAPYCEKSSNGVGCYASSNSGTAISTEGSSSTLALSPPTTHREQVTTTVTVSVIPNPKGFSLEFPAGSTSQSLTIDYVLGWPATSNAVPTSAPYSTEILPPSSIGVSVSSAILTDTSSATTLSKTSDTSLAIISSASSALCFNDVLISLNPCPTTTSKQNPYYSPAGSTIIQTSLACKASKVAPLQAIIAMIGWKADSSPSCIAWVLFFFTALFTILIYCTHPYCTASAAAFEQVRTQVYPVLSRRDKT